MDLFQRFIIGGGTSGKAPVVQLVWNDTSTTEDRSCTETICSYTMKILINDTDNDVNTISVYRSTDGITWLKIISNMYPNTSFDGSITNPTTLSWYKVEVRDLEGNIVTSNILKYTKVVYDKGSMVLVHRNVEYQPFSITNVVNELEVLKTFWFEGVYADNDPIHPDGGQVTYLDTNNTQQTEKYFYVGLCRPMSDNAIKIISKLGIQAGECNPTTISQYVELLFRNKAVTGIAKIRARDVSNTLSPSIITDVNGSDMESPPNYILRPNPGTTLGPNAQTAFRFTGLPISNTNEYFIKLAVEDPTNPDSIYIYSWKIKIK